MIFSSSLIEDSVNEFSKLPGIGKKTAMRLVLHLLKQDEVVIQKFSQTLMKMRTDIKYCSICHNVSDHEICKICNDHTRKKGQICVVESIRDVMAIEATQQYSGLYHVLGGLISPLDGIGPDTLNIQSLVVRLEQQKTDELIIAISPTIEGDTTSYYITKKIKHLPIKVTTLSRGVAFGGELEYADELTLARSILSRMPIENIVSGSY
ncbi:MAG TPA: recombination mediator RecR [Chitinophagaceae bacterium]|jgi:recombination protein RecR|nr:recombination mediator RecR [Chitinophagaceae bacterium]